MSIPRIAALMLVCASMSLTVVSARADASLKGFFNDAAVKVAATPDPAQKRTILTNELQKVSAALNVAKQLPIVSAADRAAIEQYGAVVQDKQDELQGANGYTRVADQNLNAFSRFVVQDMEQADQVITISLITVILIVILIILIVH